MINLAVQGNVTLGNNAYIGKTAARINQAYIGGNCNGHTRAAGTAAGMRSGRTRPGRAFRRSTRRPPIFPTGTSTRRRPEVSVHDPDGHASGVRERGRQSHRNTSAGTINLTPAASYTCQNGSGTLSWNSATHTLTIAGAIFIDGNVTVGDGTIDQYNGQASIYVNGTLSFGGNKVCGGISGSSCDFSAWNPNTEMLIFVVNGTAGGANDYGVTLSNNAQFQGGIFATHTVLIDNNSTTDGPMIAS